MTIGDPNLNCAPISLGKIELPSMPKSSASMYPPPSRGVFPSAHAIGDEVLLRFNYEGKSGGQPCLVVGVGFHEGKVTYDLAVILNGEPYEAVPLRNVDSIFVSAQ